MPSGSYIYPSGPESVTTFAPNSVAFVTAPHATFPNPLTAIILSFMSISFVQASVLRNKALRMPVASGRMSEPPNSKSFTSKRPGIFLF